MLLLVTVVSEKCKKETETEETNGFFVTFLSLVKFRLGRGPDPLPPLATPMLKLRKTKTVFAKFERGFWCFTTKF